MKMFVVYAVCNEPYQSVCLGDKFETKELALEAARDFEIEGCDDGFAEEWEYSVIEVDDEYEKPYDIDDDCGFDPYMGCYTGDC